MLDHIYELIDEEEYYKNLKLKEEQKMKVALVKTVEAEPMSLMEFVSKFYSEHVLETEDKPGYLTTDLNGVKVWVSASNVGEGKLYEVKQ